MWHLLYLILIWNWIAGIRFTNILFHLYMLIPLLDWNYYSDFELYSCIIPPNRHTLSSIPNTQSKSERTQWCQVHSHYCVYQYYTGNSVGDCILHNSQCLCKFENSLCLSSSYQLDTCNSSTWINVYTKGSCIILL